jgi:exopolysaccharide biosynthesis polyprenyl glycosylphosphotransferase
MFWGGSHAASGGIDASNGRLDSVSLAPPPAAGTRTHTRTDRSASVRIPARPVAEAGLAEIRAAAPIGRRDRTSWIRRYRASLIGIDLASGILAASLAFVVRFGDSGADDIAHVDLIFGLLLPLAWVGVIAFNRAYEARFVGVGSAEFDRVFRAFLHLTAATVFISYLSKAPVARGYVIAALPLALALDLSGRYLARKRLHKKRARGECFTSVLAVGSVDAIAEFTSLLRHDTHAGMRVVGACVTTGDVQASRLLDALGVKVLGDVDSIVDSAKTCGAHSVAVVSGELSGEKLRWISWQLEGTDTDLIVAPGLAEVGGRRLHIQPVAGLPLLHVEEPEFTGFRRMLKGAFDRTVAGLALIFLSPILIGLGLIVRLTSHGPALFTQTRVGRNGQTFKMIKFRSMVADAEDRRHELIEQNESAGPLFKMRADPRITPVGRFLRRFSLDELPQLINVVTGSMSLVGPRPPLPDEVSTYCDDVRRRLLVKPGLTGLWQISGRSDLSWEESVRLDLRYVENWTLALDMVVLWKTARAVFSADGAY